MAILSHSDQTLHQEYRKSVDTEINLFRNFNTIENNFILNSFAHSIQTLNKLNKEKWEPDRPELTSVMFFFELLDEFFKRRGLKTKYKIGEKIKLSYNTIDEFEYEGTEFSDAKDKKKVIVQYPAWYFKKTLISKAKVVELKKKKV